MAELTYPSVSVRLAHFGVDECKHIAVLASSGYAVHDCGTSIGTLSEVLGREKVELVVFTRDTTGRGEEAIRLARALSSALLVLFEVVPQRYDASNFDLVIPSFTSPVEWLKNIAELVEQTRAAGRNASSRSHKKNPGSRRDCSILT